MLKQKVFPKKNKNIVLNLRANIAWIRSKFVGTDSKKHNYRKQIKAKANKMKQYFKKGTFIDYIVRDEASYNSAMSDDQAKKFLTNNITNFEFAKTMETPHFSGLYEINKVNSSPIMVSDKEIKKVYKDFKNIDYQNQVVFTGVVSLENNYLNHNNISIPQFSKTLANNLPKLFKSSRLSKEEIQDLKIGYAIHTNTHHLHAHFYAFSPDKTRVNKISHEPDWNYRYTISRDGMSSFKKAMDNEIQELKLNQVQEMTPNFYQRMKHKLELVDNAVFLDYETQKDLYHDLRKAKSEKDYKKISRKIADSLPMAKQLENMISEINEQRLVQRLEPISFSYDNKYFAKQIADISNGPLSSPHNPTSFLKNLTNKTESNTSYRLNNLATEMNIATINQINEIKFSDNNENRFVLNEKLKMEPNFTIIENQEKENLKQDWVLKEEFVQQEKEQKFQQEQEEFGFEYESNHQFEQDMEEKYDSGQEVEMEFPNNLDDDLLDDLSKKFEPFMKQNQTEKENLTEEYDDMFDDFDETALNEEQKQEESEEESLEDIVDDIDFDEI